MHPCNPSPCQLNLSLGGDFLFEMIERFGVAGWNAWISSMALDYMPIGWDEGEPIPPVWYWLDFSSTDFSRQDLDGLNLAIPVCRECIFDGASLVKSVFRYCPQSSFRGADLRRADFRYSYIGGADFTGAQLEGVKLKGSTFDADCPPIGLPTELLLVCRAEPREKTGGAGAVEYPVSITACLTGLRMPKK